MTNADLTLIAALLDRSGSMQDCKRATETGFDELIAKQRTEPGRAVVTLSMFDDVYENVYANVPIAEVTPLNLEPRNMTAMLDATGRFITEIGEQLAGLPEADRPGERLHLQPRLQVDQLALGPAASQVARLQGRHAGRIVAAVFEPLQRLDNAARYRIPAEHPDNSTHASVSPDVSPRARPLVQTSSSHIA